ncbi:MAG TPA: CDP-diacylglycerol--glycerol-3-phosphate 3-phosphatidyltransferase [Candidatus Atribacteria bacterium]|nr:CDP-diacylglycerol--glycerol-3-phosphate 3-phosphatidyltransferase [Candidatus Atribacteria bacterium]HPT78299.1 CDP-diacylglycerol--glycerol-3-phosphate 3-phosphatidyltransferase [Candidatus Atribacteria bacterium]
MNIPNTLTVIRFLMIGLFAFLYLNEGIKSNEIWAFIVFLAAGATDVLDGFIARRYNLVTDWGKLMDPLADKLMLITVMVCMYIDGIVPLWVIIVIALKELLMILGAAFLYKKDIIVQANFYGKLATVLFYVAITLQVFKVQPYAWYVLLIAIASTIMAFIQYTIIGYKRKKG